MDNIKITNTCWQKASINICGHAWRQARNGIMLTVSPRPCSPPTYLKKRFDELSWNFCIDIDGSYKMCTNDFGNLEFHEF